MNHNYKIKLKNYSEGDMERLYELVKHDEVHRFLDIQVGTKEEYIKWMEEIELMELMGESLHRTIWNEKQDLIGEVYLTNIDQQHGIAEMGTWIGRKYWSQGYNQSIKQEALKIAFYQLNLRTVYLFIQKENSRAIESLKKIGYVRLPSEPIFQKLLKYKEFKVGNPIELFIIKKEDFIKSS